MASSDDRKDYGLVIAVLCALKDWNQMELSRASGVDKDSISDYWHGIKDPLRKTRERLAAAFGVDAAFLEQLLPVCRRIRLAFEAAVQGGRAPAPHAGEAAPRLQGKVTEAVLEAMAPFLLQLSQLDARPTPSAEDRAWAEERWAALAPLPAEEQAAVVHALSRDERSWALAVRLCAASEISAAASAAESLRLARLAAGLAREAPGTPEWRLLLLGFCELFVANALRVGGNLAAAGEAFARADDLLERGEGGDPDGLLDGTRRLDLKASLLRQQGRFAEALDHLDRALAGSPPEAAARLLIQKSATHTRAGDYELSLATLREAEPRIDREREPRLVYGYHFSRTLNFLHLDRYEEAKALLPRVEALADPRTVLDRVRTLWLQGRTWAGLGRREEAVALLTAVRQHFLAEEIAYDFALVSLELATLHLEVGRTRLVRELAAEMLWIFKSQKVHQEALAALALFRRAAEVEKAQAAWTRRLVKYLYRAQDDPGLRFEG